jgi:hypothetical protein
MPDWVNVTNSQIQITGNIPFQRAFVFHYFCWKGAFQVTAALQRYQAPGTTLAASPIQLTGDPTSASGQQFAAQFQQNIGNDMTLGFELNRERIGLLRQSLSRSGGSPRAFGNALLNCIAIKQRLNIMGVPLTVGAQVDSDLCFWSVQVPLNEWNPEFPGWAVLGEGERIRANFVGNATLKFGLSAMGWQWVSQQLGRTALRPLIQRIGQFAGRQALTRIATWAGTAAGVTAVSIVGGVVGGVALAYLTARFTGAARAAGRHWAHCGQYAAGYVGAAWIRYGGTAEAQEADLSRACGHQRRGHTGDQIRLIGVGDALGDIEQAGGGIGAARRVRQSLVSRLGLNASAPRRQIISELTEALRRGSFER